MSGSLKRDAGSHTPVVPICFWAAPHPVTPEQRRQCRAIGSRLAVYVRQPGARRPSASTLQAVAADLAAGNGDLVLPLKDLVTRPAFQQLTSKAGSGRGSLERQALLQTLQSTFAPSVVDALAEVLSGFLDLPGDSGRPQPPDQSQGEPPLRPLNPPPLSPPAQRNLERGQPPVSEPQAQRDSRPVQRAQSLPQLMALSLATAVVGAGVVGVGVVTLTRVPQLCAPLGLCPAQPDASSTDRSMQAARTAEQELRRAAGLDDYRRATERLERELLQLSRENLTSGQDQQRQQLMTTARQARGIVAQEEADLRHLERANQALDAARSLNGTERQAPLEAARQAVEAIPPRSFSAAEALRLRERLLELEKALRTPDESAAAPVTPKQAPLSSGSKPANTATAPYPAPAPARTASPRRAPRASEPSPAPDPAPYREQPLF